MIVLELIKNHNPKEIINALIKSDFHEISQYDPEKVRGLYGKFISEIWDMEPVTTDHMLFVGALQYDDFDEGDAFLSALLYEKSNLESEYSFPSVLNENTDISKFSKTEILEILNKIKSPYIDSFAWMPWAEILGTTLIDENMNDIKTLDLVVDILNQMTLMGFTVCDVESRITEIREEVEKSTEKIEEDLQRGEKFGNLDDLFNKLRAKLELRDPRSAEEKERDDLLYKQHELENKIEIYKCLKKYNLCRLNLV